MTQRQCRSIGSVGWLWTACKAEARLDHLLDLLLVGSTPSGDGVFHLARTVLGDDASPRRRLGEHHSTGLADTHRGPNIVLEEDLFNRHVVGGVLGDQAGDLGSQGCKPVGQWVARGGADDSERYRSNLRGRSSLEHGVAAARKAGINAENPPYATGIGARSGSNRSEHKFGVYCRRPRGRWITALRGRRRALRPVDRSGRQSPDGRSESHLRHRR